MSTDAVVTIAFVAFVVGIAIWSQVYLYFHNRKTEKIWERIRKQQVVWAETHNINRKDLR